MPLPILALTCLDSQLNSNPQPVCLVAGVRLSDLSKRRSLRLALERLLRPRERLELSQMRPVSLVSRLDQPRAFLAVLLVPSVHSQHRVLQNVPLNFWVKVQN